METFIDLTSDDEENGDNQVHHPLQLQAPGSIPISASFSEDGRDPAHPIDLKAEIDPRGRLSLFTLRTHPHHASQLPTIYLRSVL